MALADILTKIEREAALEADRIRSEGDKQAHIVTADAEAKARKHADYRLAQARAKTEAVVETVYAKARVEGRDLVLKTKREMIDEAFAHAADAISKLGDDEWLAVFMPSIIEMGRSGEVVLLGSEDESRRIGLTDALAGIEGTTLTVSPEAAPFAHGVYILGDKTNVSLSVTEIIDTKRRVLEPKIAEILTAEKRDI